MDAPRLHAILVTYRRPQTLAAHLDVVAAQTRRPDRLLVVDNGADPASRAAVAAARDRGLAVEVFEAPENLGPAGAIAHGMRAVLADPATSDDDWVVLLDDDDPPPTGSSLADALAFGVAEQARSAASGGHLGGVGGVGARFDPVRGVIVRLADHQLFGSVGVDYLGSNHLPCYRVEMLRQVGVFDERIFFGFEELEFGLRVRSSGWDLRVDGDRWYEARRSASRLGAEVGRPTVSHHRPPWRTYYNTRSLVLIERRQRHLLGAGRVTARLTAKAALGVVRRSPDAFQHLTLAVRGAGDGWRDRLGRTVVTTAKPGVA